MDLTHDEEDARIIHHGDGVTEETTNVDRGSTISTTTIVKRNSLPIAEMTITREKRGRKQETGQSMQSHDLSPLAGMRREITLMNGLKVGPRGLSYNGASGSMYVGF